MPNAETRNNGGRGKGLRGTELTLGIADRAFDTDVRIKPGAYGNLPAGEIWCAPIEDQAPLLRHRRTA